MTTESTTWDIERVWSATTEALDQKPSALDYPDAFYDDEWEQVIQAHGVTTGDEYLRVSRVGRGTRLNRAARAAAWRVFEEYRIQLAERGLKEVDDAYRDAAALLQDDRDALDYAAVIVDEAQDMGAQAYRLIRNIVPTGPDDLFVAGDGHQRIYGRNKVVLGRCGIDVRGRARKLRLNYRTTEQTRRWAARLLAGRAIDDLDGGSDDDKGITSLTRGPEPLLRHFQNSEEQSACIVAYLKQVQTEDASLRGVCVVARTRRERDTIANTARTRSAPRRTRSRRRRHGGDGGRPTRNHAPRQGPGVRPRRHGQHQLRPGAAAHRHRRAR